MKIIYNKLIPFDGYAAINLFGILFVREGVKISDRLINHESIHSEQMKEMLYIFFYLWYVIEWVVKLFKYGDEAYRNISFEREAYDNDRNEIYISKRKKYAWLKLL